MSSAKESEWLPRLMSNECRCGTPPLSAKATFRGSSGGSPGRFDQFPELGIFLQRLVFAGREAGTEQEILERVAAEDPMHDNSQLMPLEINAIIPQPKPVQNLPVPLQFPKPLQVRSHDFLRQSAELPQNVQLQFLGHLRQFGRTRGIEDDLKGSHFPDCRCSTQPRMDTNEHGSRITKRSAPIPTSGV